MKFIWLFSISFVNAIICHGQISINPSIENSNCKSCKIIKVDIQSSKTIVTLEITETRGSLAGPWVQINSSTYLSNFYNPSESFKILSLGDRILDTKYSTKKGEKYIFTLIFHKVPPGIEKINIKEILPEGGGWEWNGISITNPLLFPNTKFQVSQTNDSMNFSNFLGGVKYANILQRKEFIKSVEENPSSPNAFIISGLISYLKSIGFSEVNFSSSQIKYYPSECEVVTVVPSWSYEKNVYSNIKLAFYSCKNDRFIFETSTIIEVSNLKNLAIDFHNTFMQMYGFKKPQFSIENRLSLPNEMTEWTEEKLKNHFKDNGADPVEGIYESSIRTALMPKYKLGLIKTDAGYNIIYFSGAPNYNDWKAGEMKAELFPTSTPTLFKADWYMGNKQINKDAYIVFESGLMNLVMQDRDKTMYIKLFPTFRDNITSTIIVPASGTGFAVSSDGLIVTNHHVVNGAKTIKIRGINGDFNKAYNAKVLIEDKNNDLALIKIDDPFFTNLGFIPFVINGKTLDVGNSVFVLGYPLRATMGDEIKLTNGIISSKSGFQGDVTSYQISAPIQPGNSGGPLFDEKGNLIGIVNAKHTGAENASYAIKASYLLNLFELMNTSPKIQTVSSVTAKPFTEQVKILKKFTYIIEVN